MASYRCYQLTRRTLECKGAVADDTSKPFSAGITPLTRPLGPRVAIVSETSGLTLVGVFHTSLSRLLNGNPPTRIQRRGNEIAVRSLPTDSILIAIFKRSEQWAYRKFVWYYR